MQQFEKIDLESIIHNSPIIVFLWKAVDNWPVEFVSDSITQFGYTPDDFTSGCYSYGDIIHPEDLEKVRSRISRHVEQGYKQFVHEYRIYTKTGDIRWVTERTFIRNNSMGKVTHYQGIIIDITERKETEKALQESEKKFRTLFNNTNDAIFICDMDGNFIEVNQSACNYLNYSRDELLQMKINDIHPSDTTIDSGEMNELVKKGYSIFETTHVNRDGAIIPIELSVQYIDYQGLPAFIVVTRNLTKRKHAEVTREKEIHHRVKNNLQVISSLLNLEASNFESDDVVEAFKNSQNRVRSMALAHEKLYQSKDLKTINFGEYLKNLAMHLFQSYLVDTESIRLNLDVEDIYLYMDKSIPLGIIVNELLSNSLKHAFSENESGVVNIKFSQGYDTNYELLINDNGKGIPEDMDFKEPESLGLELVNTLVEQVDGMIELDKSCGTEFRIKF
ncbi:signal transduction histidine kinase [Methanohalobium evestigatum Z-7303]|uniref:Signal transduction histidine kinase n=1 Tax=Methanohalobium evestigatum (strain ATCC BAA-1072 / DSM 3721 / NBRC 107634 / OCM 161 / Z-7303) TaxID=644295 RepID=D7E7E9_METEZ|nr:PAS domain S-box protein [Methanohalobium evestigatum]ADI73898.1 signal transduction histidine kinase [Methanohalobium evestigatum Z-7303]